MSFKHSLCTPNMCCMFVLGLDAACCHALPLLQGNLPVCKANPVDIGG